MVLRSRRRRRKAFTVMLQPLPGNRHGRDPARRPRPRQRPECVFKRVITVDLPSDARSARTYDQSRLHTIARETQRS